MTPENVRFLGERRAEWIRDQNDNTPNLGSSLLGALLGEAMEGYRRTGKLVRSKVHACLIHGEGDKPDEQDDDAEERAFQACLDRMPRFMGEIKKCLYAEFLWGHLRGASPQDLARRVRLSLPTYKAHVESGLRWIAANLP